MFRTVCALALATLSQASDLSDSLTVFSQDASSFINDLAEVTQDIIADNEETSNAVASIIDETIYQGSLIYDFMDKMGAGPGCAAHCTKQAYACAADEICKKNLECVAGNCDISNSTCTFTCSESYMSPKIDDLMSCMFVEYECAALPPPDPINNATCRDPTNYITEVDTSLLNGDWYTIRGFNPLYDCYDCAIQTWTQAEDGSVTYDALFDMLAFNGTKIWPLKTMVGEDSTNPGILSLDGSENGLPDHQNWYVMHLTEDTFVSYYCGTVLTWKFEGLLVMSRTTSVNPNDEPAIQAILDSLDMDASELCILDAETQCAAAPRLFIQ